MFRIKKMGVEKTKPRRAINKKNKTRVVFDESARKEFLTGFRKRKDERRRQWKEKVDRQLKNEIKKIKGETQAKVEKGMSKTNSSNHIVPEVAHLINSNLADTTVSDCGDASVTITTLDSLQAVATPWRQESDNESSESDDDDDQKQEEMPGMSLTAPEVNHVVIGCKEKKALNRAAMNQIHKSKAFKAQERIKAKKQRNMNRFKKKKLSKKAKFLKKIGAGKSNE